MNYFKSNRICIRIFQSIFYGVLLGVISLLFGQTISNDFNFDSKLFVSENRLGIKKHIEIAYAYEEKFGELFEYIDSRIINDYDQNGNLLNQLVYDSEVYENDEVQFIGKSIFKYDNNGNEIEQTYFDSTGNIIERSVKKYDEKGNVIDFIKYDSLYSFHEKLFYRKTGEITRNEIFNLKGQLINVIKWDYDRYGNQIEISRYNSNGQLENDYFDMSKEVAHYSTNGLLMQRMNFDSDGKLIKNTTFEYDKNDSLKQLIDYFLNYSGQVNLEKNIFNYDSIGNEIKTSKYDGEGKLKEDMTGVSIWMYEYDSNRNIIKANGFDDDSSLYAIDERKYDSKNNLIDNKDFFVDYLINYPNHYVQTSFNYDGKNRLIEKINYYQEPKFGRFVKRVTKKITHEYEDYNLND